MKIKIMTANIAFGLRNMDNLFVNILGHLVFHGWSIISVFINPASLRYGKSFPNPKRIPYIKKHGSLKLILDLIKKENPDILMLNEIIKQIHPQELKDSLQEFGYKSINFGYAIHHDDATCGSLVASKVVGEPIEIKFTLGRHAGGGAGVAILRLLNSNITIAAVHMSVPDKFPWLYDAEVEDLAEFISNEQSLGREVIIAGDWNTSTQFLQKYSSFTKLGLKNGEGDIPSCPTFLPKLKPLDHIFVPSKWKTLNAKTMSFGSDHLAVSICVEN